MSKDPGRGLSARQRGIVALGVLIDGFEASRYLDGDSQLGDRLAIAAQELADSAPEVRLPLAATKWREAIGEHRLMRERSPTESLESLGGSSERRRR